MDNERTELEIRSDDFKIECPHCGFIQERVYIGGLEYDPSFPCEGDCGGLIQLEITVIEG